MNMAGFLREEHDTDELFATCSHKRACKRLFDLYGDDYQTADEWCGCHVDCWSPRDEDCPMGLSGTARCAR